MLLVERAEADAVSPGGVLLPPESRGATTVGRVLQTGPPGIDEASGREVKCDISAEDYVIFGKDEGVEVKYDGKKCVLLGGLEVKARLEKSASGELHASAVRPLEDNLFVRVEAPAEKSGGGVLQAKRDMDGQEARLVSVVAAGPGSRDRGGGRLVTPAGAGARALVAPFAIDANLIRLGGEEYAFVAGRDVLALV